MPIHSSMKVLMVSAEAHPLVKVGGLGDAVGALSRSLRTLDTDVRILLPNYRQIELDRSQDAIQPLSIGNIRIGSHRYAARILVVEINGVPVYLLDIPELYDRDGIYGPRIDQAFDDNLLRYAALCAAVDNLSSAINWTPDVLHGHDWQAGLAPCMTDPESPTAHLLTIHNIGYQGDFPAEQAIDIGLSPRAAKECGLIHKRRLNLLAGGIHSSDAISTVSQTYAHEISHHFGFGLEKAVRRRAHELSGITNGMDYTEWDPGRDPDIAETYDRDHMDGKKACKLALQREFGLEESSTIPLFGMVTRLVEQKGIVEFADPEQGVLKNLCREGGIQLVVLGSGERWCEDELQHTAETCPELGLHIGYDAVMAHRIAAGADFFLMPSRYEPCGLSQLYAMRYGALPVATRTGGIADTVADNSTGFLISKADPQHISDGIHRAVGCFSNDHAHYTSIQRTAMEQRFSWGDSASAYIELYEHTIDEHRYSRPRRRRRR